MGERRDWLEMTSLSLCLGLIVNNACFDMMAKRSQHGKQSDIIKETPRQNL